MNKETIKEFLKPSKWKILVFVILEVVCVPISFIFSFPFSILRHIYVTCPLPGMEGCMGLAVVYQNIPLNLTIYYLLSCLIIFAYSKFRSGKQ